MGNTIKKRKIKDANLQNEKKRISNCSLPRIHSQLSLNKDLIGMLEKYNLAFVGEIARSNQNVVYRVKCNHNPCVLMKQNLELTSCPLVFTVKHGFIRTNEICAWYTLQKDNITPLLIHHSVEKIENKKSKSFLFIQEGKPWIFSQKPLSRHMMSKFFRTLMILHSYNITHNDIKPTNWVFLDSKPKLIDFGAAEKYYKGCFSAYPYDGKYCARPANETTYQFMSPEQVEYFIECLRTGNRAEICIDAKQSDVWSLGYAIVWMHKKELHRIPSPIEPSWFENADKVSKEIKQQVITEFVQFNKRRQQVLNDLKLPFPLDLVLLAECPSKRPTATQTVQCLVNGYFRACPINLKVALEIKHVVFPYRQATLNKLFVWVNRLKTDLKCFFESVAYLDYYLLKNQDNDLTKYLPSSTIKLRNIDTSTLKGQYLALGYVCVYLAWLCLEKRPFGEYIQHWSKSGEFATFVVQVSNHVKYIFHAHTSLMTEYQHLDLSARQDFFLTARQSLL